jgi:hypothetical protein
MMYPQELTRVAMPMARVVRARADLLLNGHRWQAALTHAYEKQVDKSIWVSEIRAVQELLGHGDVKTIMIQIHVPGVPPWRRAARVTVHM